MQTGCFLFAKLNGRLSRALSLFFVIVWVFLWKADQSQPNQPCSHGEFRIFRLLWLWTCCFQFLCHFGKGKAKLNVAFQLPSMESIFLFSCRLVKLEKSEFDCSLCKSCVIVQHMVSAVVVVLISAIICTVRRIPDVCKLCHVGGLFLVQLFDELGIDRSAISVHSALVDFQVPYRFNLNNR